MLMEGRPVGWLCGSFRLSRGSVLNHLNHKRPLWTPFAHHRRKLFGSPRVIALGSAKPSLVSHAG